MRTDGHFQGSKLRLARLLNGFTKAELADRLAVSRQFVHTLELGEKVPSNELLAALALLLKVQPTFFVSPLNNEVREEECHFRSRRSMPAKVAEQIIAHGTAFEILVRHLDEFLSLPKVNFPHVDVSSDDSIEDAADACRRYWKLGDGPIENMCRVLENAGAVITFFNTDRPEVDALGIARSRPIIVRNTVKESPGRLRFDLAHEAAHFLIHQAIDTGDPETEGQADRFASAFLMPRNKFSQEFPVMPNRIDWQAIYSLKVRWRVSARAVVKRAETLGLLNALQSQVAYRYLNQSGQAKIERYDDRIPFEQPELIAAATNAYLSTFQVTLAELSRRLGMTPALIARLAPGILGPQSAATVVAGSELSTQISTLPRSGKLGPDVV